MSWSSSKESVVARLRIPDIAGTYSRTVLSFFFHCFLSWSTLPTSRSDRPSVRSDTAQVTVLPLAFFFAVHRPSPCKAEFVAMLGCWAATGDVLSADAAKCKQVADVLFNCMRTTVGGPSSFASRSATQTAVARLPQTTETVHQLSSQ